MRRSEIIRHFYGGGISKISLERCGNLVERDNNTIPFGLDDLGSICWDIKSPLEQKVEKNYTEFFKTRWTEKDSNWNLNTSQDQWAKQCSYFDDLSSQWAIYDSSSFSGAQYLGFCENTNNIENIKFIKKVKEWKKDINKDELIFWVCDKNCWRLDSASMEGFAISLEESQLNSENWKQVEFYKTSKDREI